MCRLLCQVIVVCLLYGVESRPRDLSPGENASCIDVFSHFSDGKVTFTDGARRVLLNKQPKGPGYKCMIKEDSYLPENGKKHKQHRHGDTFNCSEEDMNFIATMCQQLMATNKSQDASAKLKRALVYPGTVWCGHGNEANGDNTKIGEFADTDSCCRAHDLCNPQIPGFTDDPKTGLNNEFPFTRLHCTCDTDFKECLKQSKDDIASAVGNMYFNLIPPTCFKEVNRCSDNSISPDCTSWDWDSVGDF
ncbi:phospholipase A2 phaiodactylipin-like [Pomacea canaliculata]|uniref:phospholipase A2 phaiodactylipin-like n=1 Tax=Pomacea canaliculata TaxID=400727 RepID=UPI000D73149E|nr:phospholipase A2 phaiodactylipin-like [Pomacea canaliculata]